MSYDVYLQGPVCSSCGHQDEGPTCPDPTYNLAPMFDLVLRLPRVATSKSRNVSHNDYGLGQLNGKTAAQSIAMLSRALLALTDPARSEEFEKLAPDNGWGTLADAQYVIKRLLELAQNTAYEHHTWRVV